LKTLNFTFPNEFDVEADKKYIQDDWLKDTKEKARKCLEEIIHKGYGLRKKLDACENKGNFTDYECNNIIAFTGDRGSGKTTAMTSWADLITKEGFALDEGLDSKEDKNVEIVSLPLIDPSKLSEGEHLLGVMVAHMFSYIKDNVSSQKNNIEKFRETAETCIKIFNEIRVKTLPLKDSFDTLNDETDYMSIFSNTVELRKGLYGLVNQYLELRKTNSNNKNFLVVTIDDIDTNIHNGYEIMEEIHHFLMIPNVIVILSVKIEQLSDLIEQKFMKDFKDIKSKRILDAHPAEMAVKYIQKIIPIPRRIALPKLSVDDISHLKICVNSKPKKDEPPRTQTYLLTDYFLKLIYDKTSIILTKDDGGAHPLIPTKLRPLRHTIILLENLEDIDIEEVKKGNNADDSAKGKEEREKLKTNLLQIETWLLDSISSNAVPRGLANILRDAVEHPDIGFSNFLMRRLNGYSVREKNRANSREFELSFNGLFGQDRSVLRILNSENPEKTVSLGDILFLLEKMLENNSGEGYLHFAAAIKMVYSIRITRRLYGEEGAEKKTEEEQEKEREAKYKNIQNILGTLICTTDQRFTTTGWEWTPNIICNRFNVDETLFINGNDCVVKTNAGETEAEADSINDLKFNVEELQWLSFFIVSFNRHPGNNPHHIMKNDKYRSRLAGLNEEYINYISTHWLRFAISILTPKHTVNNFLWRYNEKAKDEARDACFSGDLYNEIDNALKEGEMPLPLNSIDLISSLIQTMEDDYLNYSDDSNGNRDFKQFSENLITSYKEIFEKTILNYKQQETLVNNLTKCKLLEYGLSPDKDSIFDFKK